MGHLSKRVVGGFRGGGWVGLQVSPSRVALCASGNFAPAPALDGLHCCFKKCPRFSALGLPRNRSFGEWGGGRAWWR